MRLSCCCCCCATTATLAASSNDARKDTLADAPAALNSRKGAPRPSTLRPGPKTAWCALCTLNSRGFPASAGHPPPSFPCSVPVRGSLSLSSRQTPAVERERTPGSASDSRPGKRRLAGAHTAHSVPDGPRVLLVGHCGLALAATSPSGGNGLHPPADLAARCRAERDRTTALHLRRACQANGTNSVASPLSPHAPHPFTRTGAPPSG